MRKVPEQHEGMRGPSEIDILKNTLKNLEISLKGQPKEELRQGAPPVPMPDDPPVTQYLRPQQDYGMQPLKEKSPPEFHAPEPAPMPPPRPLSREDEFHAP
ncbi:MAG: hypothetical protein RDV48_17010, partial [Candidatus Eremiobacteraeota bacterium]|nr:hypothetical protein [Candidatus Eremiobacteraeota bacterium]